MGKYLLINDADFSENALGNLNGGYWLLGNENIFNSNTNLNSERTFWPSGEAVSKLIRSKHVTKVKFKCGAVGNYVIQHATTMVVSSAVITTLATIACSSSDVGKVVEADVDFVFPANGFLACACDVSGVMQYLYDTTITTAVVKLNPIYTNAGGSKPLLESRFYNNDFFVSAI